MSRGVKITPPPHAAPPRSAPTSPPQGSSHAASAVGTNVPSRSSKLAADLLPASEGRPARLLFRSCACSCWLSESELTCRAQSAERRVQGAGCGVQGAGCRVQAQVGGERTRHTRHAAPVALGASGAEWRGGLGAHLVQRGPRHVEAGGQPDGAAAPPAAHGLHRVRVAHGLALQEDGRAVVE